MAWEHTTEDNLYRCVFIFGVFLIKYAASKRHFNEEEPKGNEEKD